MNRYLLDTIEQQNYLPEINAESCVYSQLEQASCQDCVDSCPTQAWILNDDELGLNIDACDGCGHCTSACSSGALSVEYPWIVRQFSNRSIALFSCEKNDIKVKAQLLPCVHIMGMRQLLLIYNSGIQHLLISTADCDKCDRYQSSDLVHQVTQLNELLLERGEPPLKLLKRSTRVWESIFSTDEIIVRGTNLSRRHFLRGDSRQLRQQMLYEDPLNLPECRTVPSGQLLPVVDNPEVHWPWSIQLDNKRCNGCDTCMNMCPTEALVFTAESEDEPSRYRVNPANCHGCGICEDVCETSAITIQQFKIASACDIQLKDTKCSSCGNTFHLPQTQDESEDSVCRICKVYSHSKDLFQVL